ncbi:DUF5011 domain-containing protein, partial [Bacillus cereus]|uniref:DUF5011 domain-containing protein n=1 Tax=Bacillus cereus TaxID=1396 RepID=UPI002149E0EB
DPLAIATATDKEDGDVTSKLKVITNKVNVNKPGKYDVKYEVIDSAGGRRTKVITVIVKERLVTSKKPVISFPETTVIQTGSTFDPLAGVTAKDYKGNNITLTKANVAWNKVNTNNAGTYQVKYRVEDSEGNYKIVYRDVVVKGFTGLKGNASVGTVVMDTAKNQITVRGQVDTLTSIVNGTESNVITIDNKVKYHLVAKDANGKEVFKNYMVRVSNNGSYSGFKTNLSLDELEKIQDSVTLSLVVETLNTSGELELGATGLNIVGEVKDDTNNVKYTSTVENGRLKITKSQMTKTSIEKETIVDNKLENEVNEIIEENKIDIDLNTDNSIENNEANKVEEVIVEEFPAENKTESLESEISNGKKEIKGTIEKVKVDTDKNLIKFEG